MPVSKKRKTADTPEGQNETSTTPALVTIESTGDEVMDEVELASPDAVNLESADREQGRQERFKALQARAVSLVQSSVDHLKVQQLTCRIEKVCSAESQRSCRGIATFSD